MGRPFVEVDFGQQCKHAQTACGDVFVSHRLADEDRIVCVLADGLGSGVKANVLATLTATMAMKYISSDIDVRRASEIIMSTLPVCSRRKVGYSTFTIVDIRDGRRVRVIEYDNPECVLMRDGAAVAVEKRRIDVETPAMGRRSLWFTEYEAQQGDYLVLFTDGVTQSGMGSEAMPLGWTLDAARGYARQACLRQPDISARLLARQISEQALRNDDGRAKDDISCGVIHFRSPRETLVLTGPPIQRQRDEVLAQLAAGFEGRKVVCGGTTANILARQLKRPVEMVLENFDPHVPPESRMEGFDLVTEGTLTLGKTAEILERGMDPDTLRTNAAVKLALLLLDSDIIRFVVGTQINEAHQDPNLPGELDIRRNLIRRLTGLLNDRYLKEATMELI